MSNKTEQHLEHAEHAGHAAHNPFDRMVTVTIAITAAILACVTMLSHRAHTETLSKQMEANEEFTKASNQWNYFQSKKNRQYAFQTAAKQAQLDLKKEDLAKPPDTAWQSVTRKEIENWNTESERYKKESGEIQDDAEKHTVNAEKAREESKHLHHLARNYDLGELGVELGLVLCSLALVTRNRNFWYSGIGCTLVGVVLASIGVVQQYLMH